MGDGYLHMMNDDVKCDGCKDLVVVKLPISTKHLIG